jgi:hypothetical protein
MTAAWSKCKHEAHNNESVKEEKQLDKSTRDSQSLLHQLLIVS